MFTIFSTSCLAIEIKPSTITANFDNEQQKRVITVKFDQKIPECEADSVASVVLNSNNYSITVDVPDRSGIDIPSATEDRRLSIENIDYLTFEGEKLCEAIAIKLNGVGYGQGRIKIREMKLDGDENTIVPANMPEQGFQWKIDEYKNLSDSTFKANLSLNDLTPVVSFSYAYSTNLDVTEENISRWWFNAEGSIPIETPSDVDETPGAETDASEEVADFIQASFRRSWSNGFNLQSLGIILRTSGRFNGIEAVGTYQPWQRFFAGGRIFTGLEGEIGYRSGTDEFENLTQRAPDRGNFLGRIGAVVEYAPELGPINRDLGSGLRFFVRGRGWTDLADNDDGDTAIRLRGFLDSEFFYNISDSSRVFLRYELGKIPPDLSNNVERLSVGFGVAF